ncbi:phytoene/squalene synthase family protein, partial [Flavobacteriaceae bacterium]|nr:phytoene/squalene synthase family protein [Flavobacteriaceae bacterium]
FLRDLKADHQGLERSYFPNINFSHFDETAKTEIIEEIEHDFRLALKGIYELPTEARFGVYTAYKYYSKLLVKLKKTTSINIKNQRISVPNYQKMGVFAKSYLKYHLKLI